MAAPSRPSQKVKELSDAFKVTVPPSLTAPGRSGYWAADDDYLYVYNGDGRADHSWLQLPAGDFIPASSLGAPGGAAVLDEAGKVPVGQLPPLADEPRTYDRHTDFNSAIPGNIVENGVWMGPYSANASWAARPQPAYDSIDGLLDAYLLSTQSVGSAGAWLVYPFVAPPGATSATFTFRGKTTTGTAAVRGGINTTSANETGVTSHTLTTTAQTFSQTVAVTPGSTYWIHYQRNGTTDTALVTRPALTFAGATGIFASDYVRLDINPKTVAANGETRLTPANAPSWSHRLSPCAEFRLWTDATSLRLETVCSGAGAGILNTSDITVIVNGVPVQLINSGTAAPGVIAFTDITLASGWKQVTIRNSEGPSGAGFDTHFHMRALYLPATAGFVREQIPSRRVVLVGDSILSGFDPTINDTIPNSGVAACILAKYPGVGSVFAKQGARLNDLTGTAAVRQAYVQRWCSQPVADFIIALGVNDYAQNVINAATFETQYGELLDEINRRAPGARVWCITPITRTQGSGEAANGLGSTLSDYRTAIANAVSTRTGYATVIDGTTVVSSADLGDGLHILKTRQMKYAMNVINAMGVGYTGS